jgi:hypothetical protein
MKVTFLDDEIVTAEENGSTFTIQQFMFNIDKFFSNDPNIVLKETDSEFSDYLIK